MAFELTVALPVITGLVLFGVDADPHLSPMLLVWAAAVAFVELLPVQSWRGMQLSTGFTLLMAVGFLYSPIAAAVTAFVGAFDPREFRREVDLAKALFNRSQIALSIFLASAVFHSVTSMQGEVVAVLGGAVLATCTDYAVNVALVTVFASISFRMRPAAVFNKLRVGRLGEFVVSYLGLGLVGVVLAQLYRGVGFWAVAAFITPVVFARQLFFRGLALEEAHKELQQREHLLEQLSNRMAEERQDERAQIAAYLHDDLAQLLFRLSLQVDIAKRHLKAGNAAEVEGGLEQIRETKNRTNEMVRALIRDLHRSPLGRAGLAEALKSFTQDVGRGSGVSFLTDVDELPLPPPIALLIYHISREAVMNSLKHSGASTVTIRLKPAEDTVRLTISDDGIGFDSDAPGPEGHFGMAMMRDRAQIAGGTFKIESVQGEGTTITATFPQSWLDEGSASTDDTPGSMTEPPPTRDVRTELPRPAAGDPSDPAEQVVLA